MRWSFRAHLTNDFLPIIQNRWKICIVIIRRLVIGLLQMLAHAKTAQLSWHVQNFVATIIIEHLMRAKNYISVKLEVMEKPLVEWAPGPALVVFVGSLILASAHSCYLDCYTAPVWWYSINKWLPLGLCKETVKELLLPEPSGRWGKGSSGDLGPSHKKICSLCNEFLFLYSVHFDFMLKSCWYRDSSVVVIWACSVKIKAKYI